MMPLSLQRELQEDVIPTDANLILLTHNHYQHMRFALPLVLAAEDQNCRIVTTQAIAEHIISTNMIESRRIIVLGQGEHANVGFVKIALAQGNKQ